MPGISLTESIAIGNEIERTIKRRKASWLASIRSLWPHGINLNLSACVGFIALFGIACP